MKHPSLLRHLIVSQAFFMGMTYLIAMGWMAHTMLGFGNGDLDRRMSYFAQRLAEAASADHGDLAGLRSRMAIAEDTFIDGYAAVDGSPGYRPVYQVWGSSGQLLYRTDPAPSSAMASAPGAFSTQTFAQHRWQTVAALSKDGRMAVHIAERWDARLLTHWLVIRDVGAIQLMAFLFCALALWLSARRGFAPLKQLAAQLCAKPAGELAQIKVERLYSETAPIVEELNGLLRREEKRLDTERSFLADAAHELRTPLASINTLAHLVVVAEDAPARRMAAGALQQGMDRVSHLLAQLLTIARADVAPQLACTEPLDLAALARERLAHFAAIARARGIDLAFDATEPLRATLDKGGFISTLDNLVDNAVRYTPSGGHVLVSLNAQLDGGIDLRVRDDGPGIPPAERERVFDRFYRLPGTVELGSGLGLSIVRKVAQSHSATVGFVEGLFGRGLGVQIVWPVIERTEAGQRRRQLAGI